MDILSEMIDGLPDPVGYIDVGDGFWNTSIKSPLNEKIANIMILPPTSEIGHHHKVAIIKSPS